MNFLSRTSLTTRLILSHAAVLLVAALVGNAYWAWHRSSTALVAALVTRQPLSTAANLAFRFGSRDDAELLVNTLSRAPADPAFAIPDRMIAELHLAALRDEQNASTGDTPHLYAAASACQRFRARNCDLPSLKALAAKLASQRVN